MPHFEQVKPLQWTRAEGAAGAALALLFACLLLASWQRWTQPLLDHGREMHLPARILAGEQLYTDVQFLYGPFAPSFNALLYGLFGVQPGRFARERGGLRGAGAGAWFTGWRGRCWTAGPAAATTGLVLVVCALKSTANYLCSRTRTRRCMGWCLPLVSLTWRRCGLLQTRRVQITGCGGQGLLAGLAVHVQTGTGLGGVGGGKCAAWLLECLDARPPVDWRTAAYCWRVDGVNVGSGGCLQRDSAAVCRGACCWRTTTCCLPRCRRSWCTSIGTSAALAQWPGSLWFSLAGLGVFAIWLGGSGLLAALVIVAAPNPAWRRLAQRAGAGVGGWACWGAQWLHCASCTCRAMSHRLLRQRSLSCRCYLFGLARRAWQKAEAWDNFPDQQRVFLLLALFSLSSRSCGRC
jgi:hypothetical protein